LPIEDIHPFQGNLKDLSKDNYAKLRKQILDLGFSSPIHVWKNTETKKYQTLDGHQRIRVLSEMKNAEKYKIPELPCVEVFADSEHQAKKKILALTSQFGEITSQGLFEFASLNNIGLDDLKDLRLPEIDMGKFEAEFFDKPLDSKGEDEVPPAPTVAKIKLGDLIILGEHRILCGDSTDMKSVERLMNGEKSDITFTSPPYNIGRSKGGSFSHEKYNNYSDDLSDEDYLSFISKFLIECQKVSKYQFINIQFLDCNRIAFISWLYAFKDNLKEIMVWNKGHGGITPDYVLHSAFENLFIFESEKVKNRAIRLNDPLKGVTNVIERQGNMVQTKEHKAGFPVYFPEYIIKTFKPKSVYDCFGGTGTTLVACENTKTKCFMMELDPVYCDVIISRYCKFTGNNQVTINGKPIDWEAN